MWKPTNTLPDGSPVELPPDVQTDIQAAVYYGGLAASLSNDMTEGNLEGSQVDAAVALGQEIAGQYNLPGLSSAIAFSGEMAKLEEDDDRPDNDMTDGNGDPLFGSDDDFTERHGDSYRAKRAA